MGKKLNFKPHTLDEKIIQDGLGAVGTLEDFPFSKDVSFVVGGIATQSYLPSSCRRGTTDIDLAVLMPLSFSEFKVFSKSSEEYLRSNSYDVSLKKGHNSYQILYSDTENSGVVEFSRRGPANFNRISDRLSKELTRSRKKIAEGKDSTYRVASPEDIVTPKLVRSINSLARNLDYLVDVSEGSEFQVTDEGVKGRLGKIAKLREEAVMHIGDPRLSERLRIVSDLYDIRMLSVLAGLNEETFLESMSLWDSFLRHPKEKNIIFKYVLPRLSTQISQ